MAIKCFSGEGHPWESGLHRRSNRILNEVKEYICTSISGDFGRRGRSQIETASSGIIELSG
jgi:hypothetical protein